MTIVDQLFEQIEALPEKDRASLLLRLRKSDPLAGGVSGKDFMATLPYLDEESAREMMEAIEAGCEQVDEEGW